MSTEEKPAEGAEPIEEETEGRDLYVLDPEDYQRTKKLQSIHKCRKAVIEYRQKKYEILRELEDHYAPVADTKKEYNAELATKVAQYGLELEPLLEKAVRKDVLTKEAVKMDFLPEEQTFNDYIINDGKRKEKAEVEHEPSGPFPDPGPKSKDYVVKVPSEGVSLNVFRQLDKNRNALGLGLDFEEDRGPAQI
jgi:hypothetical protein